MINKILALSLVPWTVLVIQNSITLHESIVVLVDRMSMKDNIHFSLEVGRLIHRTQIERGMMTLYISTGCDPSLDKRLHEAYLETDKAIKALSKWKRTSVPDNFESKQHYFENIRRFRNKTEYHNFTDVVKFFSNDNAILVSWMVESLAEERKSDIWGELVAYQMLVRGKEYTGIERALGSIYFSKDSIDQETMMWYTGIHEKGIVFLSLFENYSAVGKHFITTLIRENTIESVTELRNTLIGNAQREVSVTSGTLWFDNMTIYINQLGHVHVAMANYISQKTEEEISNYQVSVVLNIAILVSTLIIVPITTFFIYKTAKTMDNIKKKLEEKTSDLEKEQVRTEMLLSQMVPSKIAKRMRIEMVEPEVLSNVFVMYAEVCHFDRIVDKSTPDELFTVINTVSDVVNKVACIHNVTRLEPYGSVFVFASGIHKPSNVSSGDKIASMAMDLVEYVRQIKIKHMCEEYIKLKIGIGTGSVTAGVIEGPLPRYRIYGAAVEDARRLAASSPQLQIQITESVYKHLSLGERFILKKRDVITDKKTVESYWLSGDSNHYVVTTDIEDSHV